MDCKKVREWLLSDYLDGELDGTGRQGAEEHLKQCNACRQFQAETASAALRPFKNLPRLQPSEAVWENLNKVLDEEEARTGMVPDILRWLKGLAETLRGLVVRPVLGGLVLASLILLGIFVTHSTPVSKNSRAYFGDEMLSLMGLHSENGTSPAEDENFGTAIEYFFMS